MCASERFSGAALATFPRRPIGPETGGGVGGPRPTRSISADASKWNRKRRSRSGCADRRTGRMPWHLLWAHCYQEGCCASRGS